LLQAFVSYYFLVLAQANAKRIGKKSGTAILLPVNSKKFSY